jgi:RNA polymerase sporulation-specific sigma factor
MQRSAGSDEELVAQSQNGDEQALTALIGRFRSLISSVARHYFIRGSDQQDVVQEGLIGLFKAIRDFDATIGTPFAVFAHLCITRQILTAVKSATRPNHEVLSSSISLEEPPPSQAHGRDWEGYVTEAAVSDPADLVVAAEEIEVMRDCLMRELSALERDALALYLEGGSYEEIAAALERHIKVPDNALQRVRCKLSRRLHQYELGHAPPSPARLPRWRGHGERVALILTSGRVTVNSATKAIGSI